jgi:hypothetical protein
VLVARRFRGDGEAAPATGIPAWLLPVGAGILSASLTVWIWGGLAAPALYHDEAAYLLQSALLARGSWSLPSPVVPEAFSQAAVLVTPVLTPKMLPGHALVLLPGVAAGVPGLMPVLLTAVTAAALVALVRRVASPGVAVLALALWLTQSAQVRWRASYLSEITTGALWLGGWWCLLRWRETRRPVWLIALAAAAGLGAVTRPLTMLVWAIPVSVLVLRDLIRLRRWRDLWVAGLVGVACLAVAPIQNVATLGSWRKSPRALYTKQYMPYDVVGFGLDSTPPALKVPPDLQRAWAGVVELHRRHTVRALPRILLIRLDRLWLQTTGQWRVVWIPAAVAGVLLLGLPGWIAVLTGLGLYLSYLIYAHEATWTVYYLEAAPIAAFVFALGLEWCLARLSARRAWPFPLALAAAVWILAVGWRDLARSRVLQGWAQAPVRRFQQAVASAGPARAIVFVRYDSAADPHKSLVRNVADPAGAAVITAYDLGDATDAVVAASFPGRVAFRFDQRPERLIPLAPGPPERRGP